MAKTCKHKFQPRYDEKWTTVMDESCNSPGHVKVDIKGGSGLVKPYMKEKTYIHDVCVKCGVTAGKEQ